MYNTRYIDFNIATGTSHELTLCGLKNRKKNQLIFLQYEFFEIFLSIFTVPISFHKVISRIMQPSSNILRDVLSTDRIFVQTRDKRGQLLRCITDSYWRNYMSHKSDRFIL